MNESIYINKRRIKAFFYSIPFYLFRLFPINKNKIVMWTFEGDGGYACSPRYIAEEIMRRREKGENGFEIYWLVKNLTKDFPPYIHKLKDTPWNRAFHMTTAFFWVSNTRTFYGTRKRKKTTYIQTWHGSLSLKPIGKYRGNHFSEMAKIVSEADSELIDYVISGSKYCTDMWPDGLLVNAAKIKELGTPRCDVLVNEVSEKYREIRDEYDLPQDAKIVIYAPTFRGGSQATKRSVNENPITIDFVRVIRALEDKFGGTWYVFLRLHPQLSVFKEGMDVNAKSDRLIDVTQRPDMSEIMAATDAIITDYSTCIFEGFLTGQPGFIYADDYDEYVADRGNLMFEPDEIPFSIARTNEELVGNIKAFDEVQYRLKSERFSEDNGIIRDGHATERVVNLM